MNKRFPCQLEHTCIFCEKILTNDTSYKFHLRTHLEEYWYECSTCAKSFKLLQTLKLHVRTVHKKIREFQCTVCQFACSDRGSLDRHMTIHTGERPFKCKICGKRFQGAKYRNHHIKRVHLKDQLVAVFPCGVCGKKFKWKGDLQTHQRSHSVEKPHSCDTCGNKFRKKQELTLHKVSHMTERNHHCEICKKVVSFKTITALKRHNLIVHQKAGKAYKCSYCEKLFKSSYHLRTHVNNNHEKKHLYFCVFCGATGNNYRKFEGHLRRHIKEKAEFSPECEVCGAVFRQRYNLNQHMLTHTGERPFNCDICGKDVSTKNILQKHRMTHQQLEPVGFRTCQLCKRVCKSKALLELHLQRHSLTKSYKCSICDKTFFTKGDVEGHMNRHLGIKPFKCTQCSSSFCTNQELRSHHLAHKDTANFACNMCQRPFKLKSNLIRHNKAPCRLLQIRPIRIIECIFCDAQFSDASRLQRHLMTHLKEKPFFCKLCNRELRTKEHLNRHLKTHLRLKAKDTPIDLDALLAL